MTEEQDRQIIDDSIGIIYNLVEMGNEQIKNENFASASYTYSLLKQMVAAMAATVSSLASNELKKEVFTDEYIDNATKVAGEIEESLDLGNYL